MFCWNRLNSTHLAVFVLLSKFYYKDLEFTTKFLSDAFFFSHSRWAFVSVSKSIDTALPGRQKNIFLHLCSIKWFDRLIWRVWKDKQTSEASFYDTELQVEVCKFWWWERRFSSHEVNTQWQGQVHENLLQTTAGFGWLTRSCNPLPPNMVSS